MTAKEIKEMKENAIAIGESKNTLIVVKRMYECGWAIETIVNGEYDYDDWCSIVTTMKKFANFAREHEIKMVLVRPEYLDMESLEKMDADFYAYREQEEYADACMASAYGDDNLMERYNRRHGIEKEYSPSNPWDAPGMSVHDFI